MAKKGNRVQVILECTEHKATGKPGTSRYITTKNKKNTPDRIELNDLRISGQTISGTVSNGDIILDADGADVLFKDGGTQYGRIGKTWKYEQCIRLRSWCTFVGIRNMGCISQRRRKYERYKR